MTSFLERSSRVLREGGLRLFVSRGLTLAIDRLSMPFAGRALQKQLARAASLDDCIDVVYGFRYRNVSVAPSQIRSEIEALLALLEESPPHVVVEIGTGLGGTTLLLARVAADDALLATVDLPLGPPRARLLRAGLRPGQRLHVLRADSHEPRTCERVRSIIGGRDVDLLFIDGDHSSQGIREDFRLYSTFVRPGGWIAFHDIVPGPDEFVGGVPDFWKGLKADREVRELVQDWSQNGLGIGLLRV